MLTRYTSSFPLSNIFYLFEYEYENRPFGAEYEYEYFGSSTMPGNAGLYIHIPFCIRKCPYCDFYSITDLNVAPSFVDALTAEMRLKKSTGEYSGLDFDSVYIGGGTPTVLDTRSIERIMAAVFDTFPVRQDAEITIEANPAAITEKQLKDIRLAGVNRINIGIQSFTDENLVFLGRLHTAADSLAALAMAEKSGFERTGIDIMYGLPGQQIENLQQDLKMAIASGAAHISCYMLTFEPKTVMDNDRVAGKFKPLDDATVGDFFLMASRMLSQNGYDHYEISNFARKPEHRSIHNSGYWNNRPYIGLGPAAHDYLPPRRTENVRSVRQYINLIQAGRSPVGESETLSRNQQMIEALYLGLRQARGIDYEIFRQRFETDFLSVFSHVVDRFADEHLLIADERGCRLTLAGMLVQESIAQTFIDLI